LRLFLVAARRQVGEVFQDRTRGPLQQLQSIEQHPALEIRFVRCAQGAAQLERNRQGPRRFDLLGMNPDQTDMGRRNAFVF
jgi:hypothetical protein